MRKQIWGHKTGQNNQQKKRKKDGVLVIIIFQADDNKKGDVKVFSYLHGFNIA